MKNLLCASVLLAGVVLIGQNETATASGCGYYGYSPSFSQSLYRPPSYYGQYSNYGRGYGSNYGYSNFRRSYPRYRSNYGFRNGHYHNYRGRGNNFGFGFSIYR